VTAGVVLGTDVPAGAVGVAATGIRAGNAPELATALPAAGTIRVVAAFSLAGVVALAAVIATLRARLATGAAETTKDPRRFTTEIVAVAGAITAGAAAAHRIVIGATIGSTRRAAARAADRGFGRRCRSREGRAGESPPGGIGRLQRRCSGSHACSQTQQAFQQRAAAAPLRQFFREPVESSVVHHITPGPAASAPGHTVIDRREFSRLRGAQ
jgi:hypothetical protein